MSKNGTWKPLNGATAEEAATIRDTGKSLRVRATLSFIVRQRVDLERSHHFATRLARELLGIEGDIEFVATLADAADRMGIKVPQADLVAFEHDYLLFAYLPQEQQLGIVEFCTECGNRWNSYRFGALEEIGAMIVTARPPLVCDWCRHQAVAQPVGALEEPAAE